VKSGRALPALPEFRRRNRGTRRIRDESAVARGLIRCQPMARTRLVLFATLAALMAPWVAPCLMAAPGAHGRMPCCAAHDDASSVRACCVPADGQPAGPASADTRLAPPDQGAVRISTFASLTAGRLLPEPRMPVLPLTLRARSRILLI